MKLIFLLVLISITTFAQNDINTSNLEDLKKLSYKDIDSIADALYGKGDFRTCIPYMIAAKEKSKVEFGTSDSMYTYYTSNIGVLNWQIGEYELAETYFLEVKSIRYKTLGNKDLTYASAINNLASLYNHLGNYALAEPFLLESKKIQEENGKTMTILYATTLNNLAGVYMDLEKYALAENTYLEAEIIYKALFGEMHPKYALFLNNISLLYDKTHKISKSIECSIKAKSIFEKTLGKTHPQYAATLHNLASFYQQEGNITAALEAELECNQLLAQTLGEQHPRYIVSLSALCEHYGLLREMDLAYISIRKSLNASSGLDLNPTFSQAWADSLIQINYPSTTHLEVMIYALVVAYNMTGLDTLNYSKKQQAIIANLANQLLKKSKYDFSNEKDKLRILGLSHDWMLRSFKVLDLDNETNVIFQISELNKGSLLLEAAKSEEHYQIGTLPQDLIEEEKKLQKEFTQLEANILKNADEKQKDSLRVLLNEVGHNIILFQKKVKEQYPKYANLKYNQEELNIADVQKVLNDSSALLSYVIGDSMIYAIYIDKKQSKVVQRSVSQSEFKNRIDRLHKVLSNYAILDKNPNLSYKEYTNHAYWFYQNLIEPLAIDKTTIKQLIIIPDGELGYLPFEAFLTKAASQNAEDGYKKLSYLLYDFSISYNYAASLFAESKSNPPSKNNGQIFALAADYSVMADSTLRLPIYQRWRKGLNPLTEAQKEIELLSKNFSGFFGFNTQATERIFKEKAGDYAIIHLAMHGLLDSKSPILSSLVFTEDHDSVENNFLQAYEISKMNLNADLVVLSACETGYGKFEKGNGIASLARSFMYAGAPALVVSLWQVNDFATSELMKAFYKNLAAGMPKDLALRNAKLEFLNIAQDIAAHPAFWSPFILLGDERPITIKTNNNNTFYFIGISLLIVVIGSVLYIKKRR